LVKKIKVVSPSEGDSRSDKAVSDQIKSDPIHPAKIGV